MAEGFLPPVIVQLLADTAEFQAQIDEASASLDELGGAADKTSAQVDAAGDSVGGKGVASAALLSGGMSKLATAVVAGGAALGAFSVDEAVKFSDSMDTLQNATGMSNAQITALGKTIMGVSDSTGASTEDLATAMGTIEQAGIHGAAAITLLDTASKAALATNTDVTDVTQTLVGVEGLHLKGVKNISQATGELVAGSHDFVGGLTAEASTLTGKVGAAFSEYGFTLKQAIEYGSVFAKTGLPTRSVSTLVTGLGKLLDPIHTVTDSNGEMEKGLSSTYLAIEQLGLKYDKIVADVKSGNLAGLLLYLKDAAVQTKEPLSVLLNTVLGSGGAAAGSTLLKNLSTVKTVTDSIKGSGTSSLNQAFTTAADQFGNKLHIIENDLKNSAAQFGLTLLPFLSKAATFVENSFTSLEQHPAEQKALEISLGTAFTAAIGVKILQAFNNSKNTGLLTAIARNTAATAERTGASAGEGGASDAELGGVALEGANGVGGTTTGVLASLSFTDAVAAFVAGALSFEATSKFLETSFGKKTGNVLTSGGSLNVLNDIATGIAHLSGSLASPTTKAGKGDTFANTKLYGELQTAIHDGNQQLIDQLNTKLTDLEQNTAAKREQLPKSKGKSTLTTNVLVHLH